MAEIHVPRPRYFTAGPGQRWFISYGGVIVGSRRGYDTRADAVAAWARLGRGGPRRPRIPKRS